MPEYQNIPVDAETKKKIIALAKAYGFGERGQGAVIRKLVNAEYEKLATLKLLPKEEEVSRVPEIDETA